MIEEKKQKLLTPLPYLILWYIWPLLRGETARRLGERLRQSKEYYRRRGVIRRGNRGLANEQGLYVQIMRERLAGMGHLWIAKNEYGRGNAAGSGGKPETFKVRFERLFYNEQAFWFKLRIRQRILFGTKNALPHKVLVSDLISPETLKELSWACERQVTATYENPRRGAWYILHRGEDMGLIPTHVKWRDMLDFYPPDISLIPWVMGVGLNRTTQTIYLGKHPHLLVAGPTLTGKSNAINGFIAGLMFYSNPDELQFRLYDFKERIEFEHWADAPHLNCPIIGKQDEGIQALQEMSEEIDRRLNILREAGAKDLPSYNQNAAQKLPIIINIIDEYAMFVNTGDKKMREEANRLVVRISALGRAAGIQIVVCTQYPTKEVVDSQIKINLNLKVVFRTQNSNQSMVVINDPRACTLPIDALGRALLALGPDIHEVQVGHCTNQDIEYVLEVARGRAAGVTRVDGKILKLVPEGAGRLICHLGGELRKKALAETFSAYGIKFSQTYAFVDQILEAGRLGDRFIVEAHGHVPRLVDTSPALEEPPVTEEDTPTATIADIQALLEPEYEPRDQLVQLREWLSVYCVPSADGSGVNSSVLFMYYRATGGTLTAEQFINHLEALGQARDTRTFKWIGIQLKEAKHE